MDKPIDLKQSVHALCTLYPELPELLAGMGFTGIIKPGMLGSVGRFMTIPKGAALKKLSLEDIKETLAAHGFTVSEQV